MPKAFVDIKNWFDDYVAGYLTDDPANNQVVRIKLEHTHRVCHNALMLSNTLGLTTHDSQIAQWTALLHDVGRFKQFALYKTFNDAASENHALLGLREIRANNLLGGWDQKDRRLIYRAIAHHNVVKLPEIKDERSLLFMKLIRDADKLDVYQVVIGNYREQNNGSSTTVLHKLPDVPDCSPKILGALMEKKVASFDDMKSLNDFKLLKIGWVFDLNFAPSFQELHRLKFIEQISETLPRTEAVVTAVNQALEHVASRI